MVPCYPCLTGHWLSGSKTCGALSVPWPFQCMWYAVGALQRVSAPGRGEAFAMMFVAVGDMLSPALSRRCLSQHHDPGGIVVCHSLVGLWSVWFG